jgi:hypothetical protein
LTIVPIQEYHFVILDTTPEIAKRPQGDIRAKRQVEPLKLKIRIKGHFRRRSKAAYKFGDIDQHSNMTGKKDYLNLFF